MNHQIRWQLTLVTAQDDNKIRRQEDDDDTREVEADFEHGFVKNRSLPLSTLIEVLKQKTGKDDIDVGKLRPTLFDVFGEDVSPKVKKFMGFLMDKLQQCDMEMHIL
ncbi:hypothetical protein GIB67_040590 [Kingdonia uniflora]|uniref:Uncharacterized protein n=1 Tax=Kingdonia uniflora TaxID=39325 RepID=A0A7J7M8U7_9MAGN|nr:hypothetical protein GIB67_040590 [Kingdonia uniflora]